MSALLDSRTIGEMAESTHRLFPSAALAMALSACASRTDHLDAAPQERAAPPAIDHSTAAPPPPEASDAPAASPEPRKDSAATFDVEVEGHEPALAISPSAEITGKRAPLIVATHGAGGRPEPICTLFHEMAPMAFVLCPRGRPTNRDDPNTGYYYPNHESLSNEVTVAVEALRTARASEVDVKRAVYAGFSQGATMGALFFIAAPTAFPRAVLIEGGTDQWTLSVARRYRAAGGERVLLICGRASCDKDAKASASALDKSGVEARAVLAAGAGQTYGGEVAKKTVESFAWLVEGDERFGQTGAHSPGDEPSR